VGTRTDARTSVSQSRYKLETVSRACALLRKFDDDRLALSLNDIMKRTGMERTVCFRLLRALESEGFLRKAGPRKYSSNVQILGGMRFRIGYASQGNNSFSAAVSQSIRWAARARHLDLIEFENNYSPKAALHNAEMLVKEGVDLAIEFQTYDRIGPRLSNLFHAAKIPVVALDVPQPGALFFGVDNHKVGQLAGKTLTRTVQTEWNGEFDELILLDIDIAGSVPNIRLSSAHAFLRKAMAGTWLTTHIDSRGEFLRSFEMTRKHLRFNSKRRTLVIGVNDFSALGALRAFEEIGCRDYCYAIGLGGVPEACRALRMPNPRLVGTVGFFPENYGDPVITLALDILHHKIVPPATYAQVKLITPENVSRFYPKDIFERTEVGEF
jgi:ribose transport system substrate-binding protein